MTLGTADAGAQKNPDCVVHVVQRHVRVALEIAGRRVIPHQAFRRDHVGDHRIPVLVLRQALLDPLAVRLTADVKRQRVGVTEHIGPVIEEVAGIAVAGQQFVNQLGTLVRLLRIQEARGLRQRGNRSRDVEINPADEFSIRRLFIGLDVVFGVIGGDKFINLLCRSERLF